MTQEGMPHPGDSSLQTPESETDIDRLIEFLHERDEPCPQCEYNLRNLLSPNCPECGHRLKLSVTLADVYLKAWIALLVSLCAGAGLGVLWILIIPRSGFPQKGWTGAAILLHILMIPAAIWLLMNRRAFLRLTRGSQWIIACIGIGVFGVSMFIVFATLR
jgi:hypothetical protein